MGQPGGGNAPPPRAEHIGPEETTGGTETSKYPEEEKSTEIPRVVASEMGRAQTRARVSLAALLHEGVWGRPSPVRQHRGAVTKRARSGRAWKGPPERVRAPYAERPRLREPVPE